MFDFANILFSGPCNARCPFCIGRQVDPALNVDNLDLFPPRNLADFVALICEHQVRQVVLTGTNTDPQLYRHEELLLATLRSTLPASTRISLHTNGRRALHRMALFDAYDRVTLSLPSFDPGVYRRMMGVDEVPDLPQILRRARVPVKISCIITEENAAETASFLSRCRALGVRRVVLRKMVGERQAWNQILNPTELDLVPTRIYRGNPVYDFAGMEVTLWDFARAESRSLNLFSSGVIKMTYLLTEVTPQPGSHPSGALTSVGRQTRSTDRDDLKLGRTVGGLDRHQVIYAAAEEPLAQG